LSVVHEIGIETAQDGVDKVLAGRVRQLDVMEYQDLAPGATPFHFLDYAGFGSMADVAHRTGKMKGLVGAKMAEGFATVAMLAENQKYVASVEVPAGEVSEEFRQQIAQPRAYHGICIHNFQKLHLGGGKSMAVTPGKFDDGKVDFMMVNAGTRKEYLTAFGGLAESDGLTVSECETTEAKLCWASVTSLTITPESRKAGSAQSHYATDGEAATLRGDSFRIGVAPTKLRVFA
jgi:diacylglycerol kinase family enzyme